MHIFPDATTLASAAAESFANLAHEAILSRGQFVVALAGGSTPKQIYQLLATKNLPWHNIHLFWGDERCVAPQDSRSNFRMVQEALLGQIQIPPSNIHRIEAELEPGVAVHNYQKQLEGIQIDLLHLGIGPDGHTASLFPATPDIAPKVLLSFPTPELEPQVPRISLGLEVLNTARVKQFFVTGASKRPIMQRVLAGENLPATQIQNPEWWVEKIVLE